MDYQYKSSLADFDFEVLNSEIEAYCSSKAVGICGVGNL